MMGQKRGLAVFSLLACMIVACQGQVTPSGSAEPSLAEPLECVERAYPCTLGEVPGEILDRSLDLSDEAGSRLEHGASIADVVAWLEDQGGIADLASDADAIRFRLEGGRGFWVARSNILGGTATRGAGARTEDQARPGLVPSLAITPREQPQPPRDQVVVGGDVPERAALVLSPMLYDFGESDDGLDVADILRDTEGFEGRVTYESNPLQTSTEVSVSDFTGWAAYDVVHVVSHGFRICDDTSCRAAIVAQDITHALTPSTSGTRGFELIDTDVKDTTGAEIVSTATIVGTKDHRYFLALGADFFRSEYQGGLKDTLVFFNACETFGGAATDLADAIAGSSSVFLGWSEKVNTYAAQAAGVAFYSNLRAGWTVDQALSDIGGLQSDGTAVLSSSGRGAGGDLRDRQVVGIEDPEVGGDLEPEAPVEIDGFLADGAADRVPFKVRVEGMEPSDAASATLTVTIDGHDSDQVKVSSGGMTDDGVWIVDGSVDLGRDVTEPELVTMKAVVELPDEGTSSLELEIRLIASGCLTGEWELDLVAYNVRLNKLLENLRNSDGDPALAIPARGAVILSFELPVEPAEPGGPHEGVVTSHMLGSGDGAFVTGYTWTTEAVDGDDLEIRVEVHIVLNQNGTYTIDGDQLTITSSSISGLPLIKFVITINGVEVTDGGALAPLPIESLALPPTGTMSISCSKDTLELTPAPGFTVVYRRVVEET